MSNDELINSEIEVESTADNELLESELEKTKQLLDERERKLNERELKAEFTENIKEISDHLNIDLSSEIKEKIESFIDYTDKKAFKASYNKIISFIEDIRKLPVARSSYSPVNGKSVKENKTALDRAFRPPKMY